MNSDIKLSIPKKSVKEIIKSSIDLNGKTELWFVVEVLAATILEEDSLCSTANFEEVRKARTKLDEAGFSVEKIGKPVQWTVEHFAEFKKSLCELSIYYDELAEAIEKKSVIDYQELQRRLRGRGRPTDLRRGMAIVLLVEHFKRTRGGPTYQLVTSILSLFGVVPDSDVAWKSVHRQYVRLVGPSSRIDMAGGRIYEKFLASIRK